LPDRLALCVREGLYVEAVGRVEPSEALSPPPVLQQAACGTQHAGFLPLTGVQHDAPPDLVDVADV
jgi:hypothetical protein